MLIEGPDGELVLGKGIVGTNNIGMVAWHVTMKKPEYSEGREVVVIANDVTVQSFWFGVEEDKLYYKASVYARKRKLPRVYIACNAGARIGLVDSKIKVKSTEPQNPSKGFYHLCHSDKYYKVLPEEAVTAKKAGRLPISFEPSMALSGELAGQRKDCWRNV